MVGWQTPSTLGSTQKTVWFSILQRAKKCWIAGDNISFGAVSGLRSPNVCAKSYFPLLASRAQSNKRNCRYAGTAKCVLYAEFTANACACHFPCFVDLHFHLPDEITGHLKPGVLARVRKPCHPVPDISVREPALSCGCRLQPRHSICCATQKDVHH